MKSSPKQWAGYSHAAIALFQGFMILGFGGCEIAPGKSLTGTCMQDADCQSGFCADGVCCDSKCYETCMSCGVPGKIGTCSPIPQFDDDPVASYACNSPAQCDGNGLCIRTLGENCADATNCASGFCVDDVCCDMACGQECMACDVDGQVGTCSPLPALSEDHLSMPACIGDYGRCDGNGQCVRPLGETCSDGTNCLSGFCVDGVCCNSSCAETCKSCIVPGSIGICINLPPNESDPSATMPCTGSGFTCNGSGVCKGENGVTCAMNSDCASGYCANGTCQTAPPLPGPIQWQWFNDQTVCKDHNGVGWDDQYPIVNLRQIVARDDESIYGVGDYALPSQGLPSYYGKPLPKDMYQDNLTILDGLHTFQVDFASAGASASWSTVAQHDWYECFANTCRVNCKGATCLSATTGLGPFIEPAGGDALFFRKKLKHSRQFTDITTITCDEGELSKRGTPQWILGTTEVCAHEEIAFAGDAAGNVVTREDDRLKKYDPSGAVVLDIPTPFNFAPKALGLSAMGNIHAAEYHSMGIRLAGTNPAGTLAWSKTFPITTPQMFEPSIELAVDALGNTLIAFYAHDTVDLGNGPMPKVGSEDIVIAKFDVQGNLLWAKRMGSGNFVPIITSMRKTGADEVALVVHFQGAIDLGDGLLQSSPVLVKYDGNGNLVWRADLLSLYPSPGPEVYSVAISGHPSGAIFVAGTGYGLASSTPDPYCDLGFAPNGLAYLPGSYPRPLRMFSAKYGP